MLKHPILQNEIEFLKETTEYLLFRSYLQPNNGQTQLHYHTKITESFTVLQGELTLTRDNEILTLKAGEKAIIQPLQVHKLYNNGNILTIFTVEVTPSIQIKKGFQLMYGLANDNRVLKNGLPKNIIHSAIALELLNSYSPIFPLFLQKIGFALLNWVGKQISIKERLMNAYCK